eukprot:2607722-Rhodomonas_salina.2
MPLSSVPALLSAILRRKGFQRRSTSGQYSNGGPLAERSSKVRQDVHTRHSLGTTYLGRTRRWA